MNGLLNNRDRSNEAKSQEKRILAMLKSGKKITPLQAMVELGCMRLGARIWELRAQGFDIMSEWFMTKKGKRVKRYYMNREVRHDSEEGAQL